MATATLDRFDIEAENEGMARAKLRQMGGEGRAIGKRIAGSKRNYRANQVWSAHKSRTTWHYHTATPYIES